MAIVGQLAREDWRLFRSVSQQYFSINQVQLRVPKIKRNTRSSCQCLTVYHINLHVKSKENNAAIHHEVYDTSSSVPQIQVAQPLPYEVTNWCLMKQWTGIGLGQGVAAPKSQEFEYGIGTSYSAPSRHSRSNGAGKWANRVNGCCVTMELTLKWRACLACVVD